MSKDKINRIKSMIDDMEFYRHLHHEDAQVFRWLIEQAERVQELENVNRVMQKANEGLERDKERLRKWIDEIESENERLRKQNIELFESNRHYLAENKWLKRRRLND